MEFLLDATFQAQKEKSTQFWGGGLMID